MSLLPSAMDLYGPWQAANLILLFVLSLVVVYQAVRGYRRHGSRPMLFLAFGVVLLTVVPIVVTIVGAQFYSARTMGLVISPVASSIRVLGLASIVYSLYGRR